MARALVLLASTASGPQSEQPPRRRRPEATNRRQRAGRARFDRDREYQARRAAHRRAAHPHLETTSLEAKNAPRELKRAGYCDDAGWQQAGWQGRLALRLLKARKDESDLRGWFDALPASYDELPVVTWTDADLNDCAYAPLREAVARAAEALEEGRGRVAYLRVLSRRRICGGRSPPC